MRRYLNLVWQKMRQIKKYSTARRCTKQTCFPAVQSRDREDRVPCAKSERVPCAWCTSGQVDQWARCPPATCAPCAASRGTEGRTWSATTESTRERSPFSATTRAAGTRPRGGPTSRGTTPGSTRPRTSSLWGTMSSTRPRTSSHNNMLSTRPQHRASQHGDSRVTTTRPRRPIDTRRASRKRDPKVTTTRAKRPSMTRASPSVTRASPSVTRASAQRDPSVPSPWAVCHQSSAVWAASPRGEHCVTRARGVSRSVILSSVTQVHVEVEQARSPRGPLRCLSCVGRTSARRTGSGPGRSERRVLPGAKPRPPGSPASLQPAAPPPAPGAPAAAEAQDHRSEQVQVPSVRRGLQGPGGPGAPHAGAHGREALRLSPARLRLPGHPEGPPQESLRGQAQHAAGPAGCGRGLILIFLVLHCSR